jgi:DNA-binding MarR family transcriptional regulator
VVEPSAHQQVVAGLARIGAVLKHHAWQRAVPAGLTPTQAQVLALLHARGAARPWRLGALAAELAVTPATASAAVSALVRKGLVRKRRARDDARAVELVLTPAGARAAAATADWPDALLRAVDTLGPGEQAALLRALTTVIRALQRSGQIPVARLCVACRYFRPHVYADPQRPHHCAFVDAPFGDAQLRLDCPDFVANDAAAADAVWQRFVAAPG